MTLREHLAQVAADFRDHLDVEVHFAASFFGAGSVYHQEETEHHRGQGLGSASGCPDCLASVAQKLAVGVKYARVGTSQPEEMDLSNLEVDPKKIN